MSAVSADQFPPFLRWDSVASPASCPAHDASCFVHDFVCTAALYFVQPGMVFVAALLYLIANAGYEGGIVFYDAFLPLQ